MHGLAYSRYSVHGRAPSSHSLSLNMYHHPTWCLSANVTIVPVLHQKVSDRRAGILFYSLLYPQSPEQCLAHSRRSRSVCCMNAFLVHFSVPCLAHSQLLSQCCSSSSYQPLHPASPISICSRKPSWVSSHLLMLGDPVATPDQVLY